MEEGKVSEKREYPSNENGVVTEQESSSKRQKLEKASRKKLETEVLHAANEKDAKRAFSLFEEYKQYLNEKPTIIISSVLRSLSKKEDEHLLLDLLSFLDSKEIQLKENEYKNIIDYYCLLHDHKKALHYIDVIHEVGSQVKFRDYENILKNISKAGSISEFHSVLQHMKTYEIEQNEIVYYYELLTYLSAKDEKGFIHCLKEMQETIPMITNHDLMNLFPQFASQFPHWSFQTTTILDTGCCCKCGEQLKLFPLTIEEKHSLANELERIIESRNLPVTATSATATASTTASATASATTATSATATSATTTPSSDSSDRLKNFHDFKNFLRDHGSIDIFIDGANIAHYKQNFEGGCFNYQQIQLITDYLIHQGYKVLILLHENHFNQPDCSLPEEWEKQGLAYRVVKGNNDDWYWMYAALASDRDAMILSNDHMRDHFFKMSHDQHFPKWREYSQIYYDIWTDVNHKKFQLYFPKKYTQCIQVHKHGFHIPFGEYKEDLKCVTTYGCLYRKPCSLLGCSIV